MRIVVHDFAGHPFQAQLSRYLARRGHVVMHWHCESYVSGKGALAREPSDPSTLSFTGLPMGSPFQRYAPVSRVRQEVMYGRDLSKRLVAARPDVVLICNTPLLSHFVAARSCHRHSIPMVFWQQDIYSAAITAAARERIGPLGSLVGVVADYLERSIARRAKAIIPISDQFSPVLARWGVSRRSTVIPNWAPLPEITLGERDNAWALRYDLDARPTAMYSGTLGLKHDPAVLLDLARAMRTTLPEGRVVVVSEGLGRDWLAAQGLSDPVDSLLLIDYQPYADFSSVLASSDVLIAILEPAAGGYSVPSKVLSYLCAGRPIVAMIPIGNAAASTLRASGAGIVVPPGSRAEAVGEVLALLGDDARRHEMGAAGRAYSEAAFDIGVVGPRFERILAASVRDQ
jgi:colanic acid biosynthesis glycosyl transferase WcaI